MFADHAAFSCETIQIFRFLCILVSIINHRFIHLLYPENRFNLLTYEAFQMYYCGLV